MFCHVMSCCAILCHVTWHVTYHVTCHVISWLNSAIQVPYLDQLMKIFVLCVVMCIHAHCRLLQSITVVHLSMIFKRSVSQIKSNQVLFKVSNVHLKEKKISRKLFTRLYSIANNNKLYIRFKYFGTSLWNRTWPSNGNIFSEF